MKTQVVNCIVHKASIALIKGESLDDFRRKLGRAAEVHAMQKLSIAKGDAWPVEVFSKTVVVNVYEYDRPANQTAKKAGLYAMGYSRDKAGEFSFESLTPVERVTGFRAKATSLTVSKAFDTTHVADGWRKAEKGLWTSLPL